MTTLKSTLKYASAELCPHKAKHTPQPTSYTEASEWAEKKLKTHTQHRCPTCGYWAIWQKRGMA